MVQKRGFTLVELLVVIGIIALLISILLPSLARARQAAVTLQCLSNLRTIGQGFVLYQQDHKGSYPFGMHNNPTAGAGWMAWPTITSRYLGATGDPSNTSPFGNALNNASMGVFLCPGKLIDVANPADLQNTYVGHPIVLASSEFVKFASNSYYPAGGKVKSQIWTYNSVWLKDASNKAIVMDGSQLLPDAVSQNGYTWPVGRLDMEANGVYPIAAKTGLTEYPKVAFDYNEYSYVANSNQDVTNRSNTAPRYRHGGDTQCNFLFGDGHAETRSYNRATGQSDLTHANFSVSFPLAN